MNKSFSIQWTQPIMKNSAEIDLPSQKTFHFTLLLVIKLVKFQIRKIKASVNSGYIMAFCSAEYTRYLVAAVRAVAHKDT